MRIPLIASVLATFGIFAFTGCNQAEAVRDWQASDHVQPPSSQIDPNRVPGSAKPIDATEVARTLWVTECVNCHGAAGCGDGNPLPAGVDFTDKSWQTARTDADLLASIASGKPPMPAYGGRLNEAQLNALVKVVRAFASNPGE